MIITWKYIKPLNDQFAVREFLKKHNIVLPEELIDFIEKYNGGRPSEKRIITSNLHEYVFKAMLSYNDDDKEKIYSVFPELFKDSQLFPFASDATGNFVCFDLINKNFYLFNHESSSAELITEMPCYFSAK